MLIALLRKKGYGQHKATPSLVLRALIEPFALALASKHHS